MLFLAVVVEAYASALASVRATATGSVWDHLVWVATEGDLILEYTVYEGETPGVLDFDVTYGEFFDASYSGCWDGCNGITTIHRSGWCKVNPEHADFDCMCGITPEMEDEFYLDEREAEDRAIERAEDRAIEVRISGEEEPF